MASRRKEYELSVEQELPAGPDGAPRRARLTARLSNEPGGAEPDDAELAQTLRELAGQLARASESAGLGRGSSSEPRADRALNELLETYHPRQLELVELLHADGELTDREYDALRSGLPSPAAESQPTSRPGVPTPGGPRTGARSVEELLRTYQITSLRQAGAVRARRQISFEEYMSLKRHFAPSDPSATASVPST